jgi:hypothetical protein
MLESIGAPFGLLMCGWAAACALVLAVFALYDFLTKKSEAFEKEVRPEPDPSTPGCTAPEPRHAHAPRRPIMTAGKTFAIAVAALAFLFIPGGSAQAQVTVGVRIGGPYYRPLYRPFYRPGVIVSTPSLLVAPRPVFVTPAPEYVAPVPATVYSGTLPVPTPVYVQPAPFLRPWLYTPIP